MDHPEIKTYTPFGFFIFAKDMIQTEFHGEEKGPLSISKVELKNKRTSIPRLLLRVGEDPMWPIIQFEVGFDTYEINSYQVELPQNLMDVRLFDVPQINGTCIHGLIGKIIRRDFDQNKFRSREVALETRDFRTINSEEYRGYN